MARRQRAARSSPAPWRGGDGDMADGEVLCVGELLWDALPAGLFLGGAPFNVACHLRAAGHAVALVSRVGDDRLGEEALRRAARYGVDTSLVQVDPARPTGFVRVELGDDDEPTFDILEPVAWDAIETSDALLRRAAGARALVFGSLAQRAAGTRRTIERACDAARGAGALLVFEANFRPPHLDRDVVRRSLERADVVKLTGKELRQIAEWFELPRKKREAREAIEALADRFGCRTVCVTRGRRGALLWREGRWTEHTGYEVEVRDRVGSGDAFLAVLLAGILMGADDRVLLQHAALVGAYVATQLGAVPADQPAVVGPSRTSIDEAPPSRSGRRRRR